MQTVGHELRVLMAVRDLRPEQVAEAAALTPWRLSRILHDRVRARDDELRRIRTAILVTDRAPR